MLHRQSASVGLIRQFHFFYPAASGGRMDLLREGSSARLGRYKILYNPTQDRCKLARTLKEWWLQAIDRRRESRLVDDGFAAACAE
jgi:hypothetical protein